MAETKPIQIFLCHASEDKVAVEAIYGRLEALDYKPWLDKKDLLPGQRWRSEIPKAIRASDYILIFLSKTSVAKRGYVQNEFKLALEVLHDIPEGTIYAIPVRLDECPIPDQFSDLQWCNLFEADGFNYLLRALQAGRQPSKAVVDTPHPASLGSAIPVQPLNDVALTRQPYEPEMILIPAGEFLMGSDPAKDKDSRGDEQPQHCLFLPDYYLAQTPVTNAQYRVFVQEDGQTLPTHWTEGKPTAAKADHPVVNVSWYDALEYCRWLSKVTGRTYGLPSEAEWEKGARGTDGRIYPWGEQWDTTRCNVTEGRWGDTTPVKAYPTGVSPYGVLDMTGNVWEWTRSLWGRCDWPPPEFGYPYNPADGRENLHAPSNVWRVLRSNTFLCDSARARSAARDKFSPEGSFKKIGFRVVMRPAS
jgi:formylglycine-generating enzyme required for sulfatase activity